MLSFLREQGIGDVPAKKAASSPADGKKPKEQEYLTVATQGKQAQKSTILLGILFAMGMLCLLFMIKKTAPRTASAVSADMEETMKIQTAITKLTGAKSEIFSGMDKIVKKFYEFSDVFQVEVDKLVKNPFELEMFLAGLRAKSEDLGFDAEAMRREQLKKQAEEMQLLSIMRSGQGNCCMIDNKIFYEGDSVGDFRISRIDENSVKLRWLPHPDKGTAETKTESVEIIKKLSE